MQRFRLLAIRPLKGCHTESLKVLTEGQIYQFYNDIIFIKDTEDINSSVIEIENVPNSHDPKSLYQTGHISVAISAIVARNGYGKSTLSELLFAAIYLLSIENEVLKNQSAGFLDEELQRLRTERIQHDSSGERPQVLGEVEIAAITSQLLSNDGLEQIKDMFIKREGTQRAFEARTKQLDREISDIIERKEQYGKMKEKVKVEVYYQIDEVCYCLRIDNDAQNVAEIVKVKSGLRPVDTSSDRDVLFSEYPELTETFFYTIAVNYSHYSLNSRFMGDWIKHLFHKNDGYRTPVVVNPMRTDGGFDINDETVFAKYRLVSNALVERALQAVPAPIYITEKQFIKSIRFRFNPRKIKSNSSVWYKDREIGGDERDREMVKELISLAFSGGKENEVYDNDLPFTDAIVKYLRQKIDKISDTYEEYKGHYIYDSSLLDKAATELLERILQEESHISYKLQQALNFLRNNLENRGRDNLIDWAKPKNDAKGDYFDYTLDDLLKWMGFPKAEDVIRHLPPSIFDMEVILSDESGTVKGDECNTDMLSSGEQQLMHSVQSIIYHLLNIQSVHLKEGSGVKYNYVNVIFDEIELYFHPDYQRKFIFTLLSSLRRLTDGGLLKDIRGLNFIFSTHSPFILSDLLQENVLLLEMKEGKSMPVKNKIQTFGANIHDLLARDFFMKSFIGEWAKTSINNTVLILNYWQALREEQKYGGQGKEGEQKRLFWKGEVANIKNEIVQRKLDLRSIDAAAFNHEKAKSLRDFISLIGEPVIKIKLISMFESLFGKDDFYKREQLRLLAEELGLEIKSKT